MPLAAAAAWPPVAAVTLTWRSAGERGTASALGALREPLWYTIWNGEVEVDIDMEAKLLCGRGLLAPARFGDFGTPVCVCVRVCSFVCGHRRLACMYAWGMSVFVVCWQCGQKRSIGHARRIG